jgi:hypothetical protein
MSKKKQEILVDTTKWETDPRVTSRLEGRGVDPEGKETRSPRDTGSALGSVPGENQFTFGPYERKPDPVVMVTHQGEIFGPPHGEGRDEEDNWGALADARAEQDRLGLEDIADQHPEDPVNSNALNQGWGGRHRRKRRTKKVKRGGKRKSKKSGRSRRRSKRRSTRK